MRPKSRKHENITDEHRVRLLARHRESHRGALRLLRCQTSGFITPVPTDSPELSKAPELQLGSSPCCSSSSSAAHSYASTTRCGARSRFCCGWRRAFQFFLGSDNWEPLRFVLPRKVENFPCRGSVSVVPSHTTQEAANEYFTSLKDQWDSASGKEIERKKALR